MALAPAVMTYDSLSAEIVGWLERQDDALLIANIPAIIGDSESLLARELKPLGFQQSYTTTMLPNNPVMPKPARWRETVSFTATVDKQVMTAAGPAFSGPPYTEVVTLLPRTLEYCSRLWRPDKVGDPAQPPLYYADIDWEHWRVAPTPDRAYPVNYLIWEHPPPLGPTSEQNWLTINAPDLLRSCCMARASIYLKNTVIAAMWRDEYTRAFGGLTAEDKRRITDRATSPAENT